MKTKTLTEEEKSIYKRDVEFFVNNLTFQNGTSETENITLEITPDLQVALLGFKGLSIEQTEELKNSINTALVGLISNFEEFRKGSINAEQGMEELDIRLSDYVEYVLRSRKKETQVI